MDILASIFFSDNFTTYPLIYKNAPPITSPPLYLRIFCKENSLDLHLPIIFQQKVREKAVEEPYLSRLKEEFSNNRVLRIAAAKKVYLQLKERERPQPLEAGRLLVIPFYLNEREEIKGALLLSPQIPGDIKRLIDNKKSELPDSLFKEETLSQMRKLLYQKLSTAPENLNELLINLPSKDMQLILNRMLNKRLVSLDMLAAYVVFLGENGDHILKNLSRQLREDITFTMRKVRLHTGSRWRRQVCYVLHRNLFKSINELGLHLSHYRRLNELKEAYLKQRVDRALVNQPFTEKLTTLAEQGQLKAFLKKCPTKELAAALAITGADYSPLKGEISRRGIAMLADEIRISSKETTLMLNCFRHLQWCIYSPQAAKWVKSGLFRERLLEELPSPTSITLEFIADELGIARTIYALKGVHSELNEPLFGGVLLTLYEDVVKGKLRFPELKGLNLTESRTTLLIQLLILKEEGVI